MSICNIEHLEEVFLSVKVEFKGKTERDWLDGESFDGGVKISKNKTSRDKKMLP